MQMKTRISKPFDESDISAHFITLHELLDALRGDESWDCPAQRSTPAFRKSTIAHGWINLLGFLRSCTSVDQLTQAELLALWIKGVALQASVDQCSGTLTIPVYCGSLDNWELNNFSVLVVQVKNTVRTRNHQRTALGQRFPTERRMEWPKTLILSSSWISAPPPTKSPAPSNTVFSHGPLAKPITQRLEHLQRPRYVLHVRWCDSQAYGVIEELHVEKAIQSVLLST